MRHFFALLVALATTVTVRSADGDLAFPNGNTPLRLRLEVTDKGKNPEAAWAAFLDRLFAHFDRDGNGVLSAAEAQRVFPLPLTSGETVAPHFATMDADHNGSVSPAEFRAFYRMLGFTPVVVIVQTAPAEVYALNEALFRHLDRDRDGRLSAAELRRAVGLLKRLDDDEDEVLTVKEILSDVTELPEAKPAGAKSVPSETRAPDAKLRLALDGKTDLATEGEAFRLLANGTRLQVPGGVCSLTISKADPASGFRTAKGFYLAQFKAAAGTKPATKALFEDDPTAQVLAGLFNAADRDGDGKLTLAELVAFFDLVELGVGCQVIVTVHDRGRTLFDLFDTNGDGRLDLAELTRAGRTLPGERALERATVPASYRLIAGRGPVGDSFGPVPFGSAASPKPPAPPAPRGPAWFRAMDKNGDGFVSPREFIGPPERFSELDSDRDGRISVDEAEAAKP